MVFLERCTVLWHLGFTRSGCFSGCPQPSSFGTKKTDVENFCTRGACAKGNSAGDASARGASIIGTSTESTFARGA